ncbi:MAG: hypothetical protein WC413_02615 [Candidatus Nanoarchaeia archaeon]
MEELKYQKPTVTKLNLIEPLTINDIARKYFHQTEFLKAMGNGDKDLGQIVMGCLTKEDCSLYNPLKTLQKEIREIMRPE